jgi:hypothetical protein
MGQLGGEISLMPLADLIIWLANRQMSGVLAVELGTHRKEFTIENGSAVRASSNEPREYFRQFLTHFGLATEAQLKQAYDTQMETRVRLGRILVMIDAVAEEQVAQVLKIKVAETMLDAFRWTTGKFFFSDQKAQPAQPEISVSVPLASIHHEGMARADLWRQFTEAFPSPQMVLQVDESKVPMHLPPESLDGRIIGLARQAMTIEALALEMHATDYQIASRLFDLYQLGVLHAREPSFTIPGPMVKPMHGRTYADLAREAMAADSIGEALHHVEEGSRQNPDDPAFGELKREVEDKAKEKIERELARYAVPTLTRELGGGEKKRLTAKERYVLARIDGYRTVEAIIQLSPMHDVEALEILKKFHIDGLIRL